MIKAIIGCVLIAGYATKIDAHMGDRIYPFYELSDDDLARINLGDSSVWDWQTTIGLPTFTSLDLQLSDLGEESSFDFNIWLGWHGATNRLYAAMERIDDVYLNQYDREDLQTLYSYLWFHDSTVSLMVDGDHSGDPNGGDSFFSATNSEEFLRENNRQTQWYIGIAETFDDGPKVNLMENGVRYFSDWFLKPPFSESGGGLSSEFANTTVTEFYITPFDQLDVTDQEQSLPSDLHPGKIIGFAMHIADFDREDERFAFTSLYHLPSHQWGHGLPSHEFVDGILIRDDDTAIEDVSWARIKFLLK